MTQAIFRRGYDVTDPDYLEANRAGRIHPDQAAILTHPLTGIIGLIRGRHPSLKIFILIPFLLIFGLFALGAMNRLSLRYVALMGFLALAIVVAAVAYGLYRFWRRRATMKEEIEQGLVRRDVGEVTFGRRDYEIKVHDRHLPLPFVGLGALSPGIEYRFYYLPRSGTLLSAEQLTFMRAQRARESLTEILARANRFQLEALRQNRRGMLAPGQITHLLSGLLIPLLFAGATVGFLGYRLRPYVGERSWSDMPTSTVVIGVILGVVGAIGFYLFVRGLLDVVGGRVLVVEGLGQTYKRTSSSSNGGSTTSYYYQIGEQRFKVSERAYRALIENLTYRAYYTPHRKTLVNVEALESPLDT